MEKSVKIVRKGVWAAKTGQEKSVRMGVGLDG